MSTDRARDELTDEIAGWTVGSGYYSAKIDTDTAREIADHLLAAGWLDPAGVRAAQADMLDEVAAEIRSVSTLGSHAPLDAGYLEARAWGLRADAPTPTAEEAKPEQTTWDQGDPEPKGVTHVHDDTDPRDGSGHWGRTADGSWKGYKDGKVYLDWPELVRRWGPVEKRETC